jgi:hypothetical protein
MAAGQFHTLSLMAFSGPCPESATDSANNRFAFLLCGGFKILDGRRGGSNCQVRSKLIICSLSGRFGCKMTVEAAVGMSNAGTHRLQEDRDTTNSFSSAHIPP